MSKVLVGAEVVSLTCTVILAVLWAHDPLGNYEPYTLIAGTTFGILEWCRQFQRARQRAVRLQISDDDGKDLTSRFATAGDDMEVVLMLRHRYFGNRVIVPDSVYLDCWRQNTYSFKIVRYRNEALGYWGLIPVDEHGFREFVANRKTHLEMLRDHCLDWRQVDTKEAYLYVIGAVVPLEPGTTETSVSLLQKIISWRVVLDFLAFGWFLSNYVEIAGVCGYPSKANGLKRLRGLRGFNELPLFVDGDKGQPIFVLRRENAASFREFLYETLRSCTF
jgi:hypothetical protein